MKEKKIQFSKGEVAEIYARAKVDFETGKEVKGEILDRERDRRKTITEERKQRALAARRAKKKESNTKKSQQRGLQRYLHTEEINKQECSVRGKAKHC